MKIENLQNVVRFELLPPQPPRGQARDRVEIGSLMLRCPTTRCEIASGIDLDRATFQKIKRMTVQVFCSGCGERHALRVGSGVLSPLKLEKRRVKAPRIEFTVSRAAVGSRLRSTQEAPLRMHAVVCEHPDVRVEERLASELIKRVRKLRWMGMDEEAAQLQFALRRIRANDVLLASPSETD